MSPTTLVALFGAGLASFLAPCVLPLLPAYLGAMAGEMNASISRQMVAAAWFVGGLVSVFVTLGLAAGSIGGLLEPDGMLTRLGGAAIVALGLALLARGRVGRDVRLPVDRLPAGRIVRPLLLGATVAAAWTPCVGPLLGSALTLAATGGRGRGAALLAAYGAGLGLPFLAGPLVLSAVPGLPARLARSTRWSTPLAAAALCGLGVLLLTGTTATVLGPVDRWFTGQA